MEEVKERLKKFNNWLDKTFSPNGKKVFLAIIILVVLDLIYLAGTHIYKSNNDTANHYPQKEDIVVTEQVEINENDKNGMVDIDIEEIENKTPDKYVSLSIEDTGRSNPFVPSNEAPLPTLNSSMDGYDLMAPPDQLPYGSEASQVVRTKVSGILYDQIKPSAILNIDGSDYVVRIGDYINGYKVLSITKELVTVQLGKNVYKAHVGEMMNNSLQQNYVYDLEHRFGGAKR